MGDELRVYSKKEVDAKDADSCHSYTMYLSDGTVHVTLPLLQLAFGEPPRCTGGVALD